MHTKLRRRHLTPFGEPTAERAGKHKLLYCAFNILLPLLSAFAVCAMSLRLAYGSYDERIFGDYFGFPLIVILNLLPILLLWGIFYCITRRNWAAFLLTAVPVLLASAGNYFKLKFRNDPFMFGDVSAIGTALGVADGYDISFTADLVIITVAVVLIAVLLSLFAGYRAKTKPCVIALVLIALSVYPLWSFVYSNDEIYDGIENYEHLNRWSYCGQYISKGFVYPFIHSITDAVHIRPDGYDEAAVESILAEHPSADIPDDKKVNIIAVQLEAYSDFTEFDIDGISEETYDFYHRLEAESYTGHLIDNVFAGGTIDTERCFLTGGTKLVEYFRDSASYVRYLNSQGYVSMGCHPCSSEFYNRRNVNEYLGFEDYRFLDGYFDRFTDQGAASDDIFFPQLLELYREAQKSGKPVFSFNVSYQGHGPYAHDSCYYPSQNWDGNGYSDYARCIMNNYLGSLQSTGVSLALFIEELRTDPEPVVVLLYGDHKPWLGDNSVVYEELGITLNNSTEERFRNMYATKYLIWANDAAKEVLGHEITGTGPDISPCYLMNVLFDRLGWEGDSYMQYMSDMMEVLPVIHSSGIFFEYGKCTTHLEVETKALYDELLCVEYYRFENFSEDK